MTDTTTTDPATEARPGFLDGFARMHDAMRRDAARLPQAVAAASDPRTTAAVRRWFGLFRSTLEHHHQREDTVIWPELVRRDPSFAGPQAELLAEHDVLDAAVAAVESALAGDGDPGGAARQLAGVLVEHLGHEEAAAFPRLAACFTEDDWGAVERSIVKGTSLRQIAFEIPWALDGLTDAEVAELEARAPFPLRVAHRLVLARRYARIAAPIRRVDR